MGQSNGKSTKPYRILAMGPLLLAWDRLAIAKNLLLKQYSGDSLTWGYYKWGKGEHPYTNRLQKRIEEATSQKIEIHNFGVNGNTTDQMLQRLPEILDAAKKQKHQYSLMILLGGTNDMGAQNPGKVIKNLLALHKMATDRGIQTVAVAIPRYQKESEIDWLIPNRQKINNTLREKFPGSFVDLEAGIALDAVDEASGSSLWDDHLHFSPSGYDRMADLIFEVIKSKIEAQLSPSSSS